MPLARAAALVFVVSIILGVFREVRGVPSHQVPSCQVPSRLLLFGVITVQYSTVQYSNKRGPRPDPALLVGTVLYCTVGGG